MSNKHRVREHRWNNGILDVMDHWFESFNEANDFAQNSDAHSSKLYNEDGEILNTVNATPATTYA
jgi:flagellar biosynthesis/type III secretory pathway chaperone